MHKTHSFIHSTIRHDFALHFQKLSSLEHNYYGYKRVATLGIMSKAVPCHIKSTVLMKPIIQSASLSRSDFASTRK